MALTIPSSRKKNYLSGIDWMIHALDYSSRKILKCGTSFAVVFELSAALDLVSFKRSFSDFCALFPHLTGTVSRDYNLAPFWKTAESSMPVFSELFAASREEVYALLENRLNETGESGFPVNVLSVQGASGTFLAFLFDHRVFDARGAELFLNEFQIFCPSNSGARGMENQSAHLDRWKSKFEAGKKINRRRIQDQKAPICSLPVKTGRNRFLIRNFNADETAAVQKRAGEFSFLPYVLAACMGGVRNLFDQRNQKENDIAASVTKDMRGPSHSALLFNQLSFLFFRLKPASARDKQAAFSELQNQLYTQIKEKMPEALSEAGMLLRILPRALIVLGLKSRPAATFSCAYLGQSSYRHELFCGVPVMNVFHMPRIPPHPGLGIFFNLYRGRLNMVLSYIDSMVSRQEALQLAAEAGDI